MSHLEARFFPNPSGLRAWLARNHASTPELWVGFYKKSSGKPSMTYREVLDEALCFGWIDSIQRSINQESYTLRFTPRKPGSPWSAANQKRVRELQKENRMQAPGLAAFQARDAQKDEERAYQRAHCELGKNLEKVFRKNRKAWEFFLTQPPGYRRIATWWVVSAKQEATRLRRLGMLMEDSAAGRRIAQLRPKAQV